MFRLFNIIRAVALAALCTIVITACGGGSGGGAGITETTSTPPAQSLPPSTPAAPPPPLAVVQLAGLTSVDGDLWDETAVRKVLNTFAYGGHATDARISEWADLRPDLAIVQMLTFDQHNLLLSPIYPADNDPLDTKDGTLMGLAQFWASDDPDNRIFPPNRQLHYDLFSATTGQVQRVWTRAANIRGLNPFRQKIGLWETNYHMATNIEVVPRRVMAPYYDAILTAHEAGLPYQTVMAEAAKSAAVAIQYDHRKNVFVDGQCLCNEDFAREFHQLFFGILGVDDPEYHETISIKNTAAALTDMKVAEDRVFGGLSNSIQYGSEKHTPGPLEILQAGIGGTNAAQRIDQLSDFAIEHPESLDNLPVKIISGLADDNLTEIKIARIRLAWRSMSEKNLLDFIHAYAISTLFHDASRIKYRTSIDRHLLIANHITLDNTEGYLDLYNPLSGYENEDVRAFYPIHNVFGGQTGEETINSAAIFQNNFGRVTEGAWVFAQSSALKYFQVWEKDWTRTVPQSTSGYIVADVAEWLWQRFVADGLKNLGPLERAHLYALLGTGIDLAYLLDSNDPDRVVTTSDIQTDPVISATVSDLSQQPLALNSPELAQRRTANERIGQAINFIVGSPFLFVEEGR